MQHDFSGLPAAAQDLAQRVTTLEDVVEQGGTTDGSAPCIPTGGETGQVLAKYSDDDHDTHWINPPEGGGNDESATCIPAGGETGQVLAKYSDDDHDTHWINPPESGEGSGTFIPLPSNLATRKMLVEGVDYTTTAGMVRRDFTILPQHISGSMSSIIPHNARVVAGGSPVTFRGSLWISSNLWGDTLPMDLSKLNFKLDNETARNVSSSDEGATIHMTFDMNASRPQLFQFQLDLTLHRQSMWFYTVEGVATPTSSTGESSLSSLNISADIEESYVENREIGWGFTTTFTERFAPTDCMSFVINGDFDFEQSGVQLIGNFNVPVRDISLLVPPSIVIRTSMIFNNAEEHNDTEFRCFWLTNHVFVLVAPPDDAPIELLESARLSNVVRTGVSSLTGQTSVGGEGGGVVRHVLHENEDFEDRSESAWTDDGFMFNACVEFKQPVGPLDEFSVHGEVNLEDWLPFFEYAHLLKGDFEMKFSRHTNFATISGSAVEDFYAIFRDVNASAAVGMFFHVGVRFPIRWEGDTLYFEFSVNDEKLAYDSSFIYTRNMLLMLLFTHITRKTVIKTPVHVVRHQAQFEPAEAPVQYSGFFAPLAAHEEALALESVQKCLAPMREALSEKINQALGQRLETLLQRES